MKGIFLFLFLGLSLAKANELKVEFYPPYPMKGDTINLVVQSDVPISLISNVPQIQGWRSSNRIGPALATNGNYYFIVQYVPEKEGEFTLPSFKVNLNGKITATPVKKVKVLPWKTTNDKNKIILTSVKYNGEETIPDKIYPGVVFTIDYKVSVLHGWHYLDQSTFNDYRPELEAEGLEIISHSGFMRKRDYEETSGYSHIDGLNYNTTTYKFQVSPIKSGQYDFRIKQQVYAVKRIRGIPRQQTHEKDVNISNTLNVTPLPAPPPDVYFLEIAGDWKVDGKLSKSEAKTGHTFELAVFVKGKDGDIKRVKAPLLKLPGFEVDPKPEIQHQSLGATIRYSLRALKKTAFPEIVFATFNHKTTEFVRHPLKLNIDISGEEIISEPLKENVKATPALENKDEMDLMLTKSTLARPLYLNISPLWYLLALALPLCYFVTFWLYRRPTMGHTKGVDVRKKALRQLKQLSAKLESGKDVESIDKELITCLAEICGLPPGSTADELAAKLADKELAEIIRNSSHRSFLPGNQRQANNTLLAAKLKKPIVVLLLGFSCLSLYGDEKMLMKSYKKGDYHAVISGYKQLIEEDNGNPAYYFNLGMAQTKLEDYVRALASFETAARLAPADIKIRDMVMNLRKKLKIQKDKDFFFIRDKLRPDQWLKITLIIWSFFWALLILQLMTGKAGKRWTAACGAIIVASCLMAYLTQQNSTYKKGQYMVTEKIPLAEGVLKAGEEITSHIKLADKVQTTIKGQEIRIDKDKLVKIW